MNTKHLLLLAAMATSTTFAQRVDEVVTPTTQRLEPVAAKQVQLHQNRDLTGKLIPMEMPTGKQRVSPKMPTATVKAYVPSEFTFMEDFEYARFAPEEEQYTYLPEGWERKSAEKGIADNQKWHMGITSDNFMTNFEFYIPACSDQYAAGLYPNNTDDQDEWLITPSITPQAGDYFNYYYHADPMYFFAINDSHTDFVNGEQTVTATLKVLISTDGGGTWQELIDHAKPFMGLSLDALKELSKSNETWQPASFDLKDYVGQSVRFAFQYVGKKGQGILVDLVTVAQPPLPEMNRVSYNDPEGTLHFGMRRDDSYVLGSAIELQPVFAELTYTNTSDPQTETPVRYEWMSIIPGTSYADYYETTDFAITYVPFEYNAEGKGMTRSYYYFPTLTAYADGYNSQSFTGLNTYMQAGGAPVYYVDNRLCNFGAGTASINDGNQLLNMGQDALPLTGYSEETDDYWTEQLRKQMDIESLPLGYLNAVCNVFPAPKAPLVINGLWVKGYGRVDSHVQFVAEVYGIDADTEELTDEPLAVAKCLGKDFTTLAWGDYYDDLITPFTFDEPLVIPAGQRYIVKMSGFHNPLVEYYQPYQTAYDDPVGNCWGWFELCAVDMNDKELPFLQPLSVWETLEKEPCNNSFCFYLDAEYPWLFIQGDESAPYDGDNTFEATRDMETRTFAINSYYDASTLDIVANTADGSLPAWIKAEASGQYDKAQLRVTAYSVPEGEATNEVTLFLMGKGVVQAFNIKQEKRGTSEGIGTAERSAQPISTYDLQGRRISKDAMHGVYVKGGKKVVR